MNKEDRFIKLIQNNRLEFMEECLSYSEKTGEFLPICKYVQLSILTNKGEELSKSEIENLKILKEKYSNIDVSHFIKYKIGNYINKALTLEDVKKELRDISIDIKNSVQDAHEKDPLKGHAAFLEYWKAIAKNIKEDRGIKYNQEFNQELYECIESFKGKRYPLTDNFFAKLKPKNFIHILTGHMEKHLIPRKGKMIKFSNIDNWKELLNLIDKVILYLSSELQEHYLNKQSEFDKYNFLFENCRYGIHLNKNAEIKTFYEVENTSANNGS